MAVKISILLYFISFLFGRVDRREQKCFVVSDSKDKVLKVLKAEYPSKQYDLYAEYMLKEFEGVPYGGGSQGCPQAHTLVNLRQMDCMTFVENFWALAFTRHLIAGMKEKPVDEEIFAIYVQNLNAIRYYEGKNQRNEDRIQYLTSGFIQLEKAGVLSMVGKEEGSPMSKKINYVSGNRAKFGGFTDWAFIQNKENEMSQYSYITFDKNQIQDYAQIAQNGDLVGLVTTVPGLDVSHCGVITLREGKVFMTHASSVRKQLVLAQDITEYLAKRTTISGIVVFRPVFPAELKFAS
jgi:hypothetical protein